MSQVISTPCVGICTSGIGDDVCRGCKRFAHEVIAWNTYTTRQRDLVQKRLDRFLVQIVKLKIYLIDINKLYLAMNEHEISFDENRDAYLWIYELIKTGYPEAIEPEVWGFSLRPAFQNLSFAALHESIEAEFHELSQAHYERYIKPGTAGSRV